MKIAIIGAGFFGTTSAVILSKKHKVHLYEKENDILLGASRKNQLRFHLGYHYPRSVKTVNEIKKNYNQFTNFFGKRIFGSTKNFYGVAANNSKTTYNDYVKFLKKNKLPFKEAKDKNFSELVSGKILSSEKNLNYFKAKKKISKELKNKNIKIYFKTLFTKKFIKDYDKIIVATYENNNKILKELGIKLIDKYKYELVEKIIIKLPNKFKNKSYMIIDGDFICLDPYIGTKFHLLSDVKNSKIEILKSKYPNFKNFKKKYLNGGVVKNKRISKFEKFIKHGAIYLPFLIKAKYIGSYYATRTVKVNKEKTDERLNQIVKNSNKIISIFSGKWNTCFGIAKELKKLI